MKGNPGAFGKNGKNPFDSSGALLSSKFSRGALLQIKNGAPISDETMKLGDSDTQNITGHSPEHLALLDSA